LAIFKLPVAAHMRITFQEFRQQRQDV
jgi:hypothetical protein